MAGVRYVVLCEDRRHKYFIENFLKAVGIHYRDFRTNTAPFGRGDASRFVLAQYVSQVKALRAKRNHQNVALLVMIDGDKFSATQRLDQFDQSLVQVKEQERAANEKICIWTPCRNIETWVMFLSGGNVNETDDFKNRVQQTQFLPAVNEFLKNFREYRQKTQIIQTLPPTIVLAFSETERII